MAELPRRKLPDWIEAFSQYTDGIPSPAIFRLWSGISTVAGGLERRVWVETMGHVVLFPNLYTLLVATPGVGKSQAIQHTGDLWMATKSLKVSPDNMTKAALVDALETAGRTLLLNETTLVQFHSLAIAASEFGVLVPAHDLDFLSVLNHIFDNPPYYRELRRGRKEEDDIIKPQLNILAGTQPAYLANLLPEAAWGQGFTSRLIMVYSSERVKTALFPIENVAEDRSKLRADLVHDLIQMTKLFGKFSWTRGAMDLAQSFNEGGILPIPEHSKLEHYTQRRLLHLLKLTMISAIAKSNELVIRQEDVERAKAWLLHAEEYMPDIFKEMVQRSDSQVIQDLHFFAWKIFMKEKRPVHKTRLYHFLQHRVPSDKVERVLDIAEKSNFFNKIAGTDTYEPRPKSEHGVE